MPIGAAITRLIRWISDTHFNHKTSFGTSPVFTNTEVVGSGDSAYLALKAKADNSDNVPFTNPADFTYDSSKIEVTGGVAKLKSNVTVVKEWDYSSSGDYNYDSGLIEVTGGVAKLKGTPVDPYLWTHLNETSGGTAYDSSSHGRNGTLINSPSWVAGKLNNCLSFNGSNQYVNFGNIANFEYNLPFSLETWVKSASATAVIMSKLNPAPTQRGWQLYFGSGKIVFLISTSTTNYIRVETNSTYNDNTWRHVVVTYNGSSDASGVIIYINGSAVATTATQNNLNGTIVNSNQLQYATTNAANYLNGSMDEVVVYDFVLIAANVTERYNSGSGTELTIGSYSIANPTIETKTGYVYTAVWDIFEDTTTLQATTNVKYILSDDDGATYKYWNGSAWVNSSGAYAQSNTEAEVNANIGSFSSSGTLKVKAFLHSDAGLATPELSSIKFIGGVTYPVGDFPIEMAIDIAPTDVFKWLTFVETVTKPTNTTVLYKYSTDSGSLYNATWLTATQTQTAIQAISSTAKIRFKIQLSTTSQYVTPEIDNILVTSDAGYEKSGSYVSTMYYPELSYSNGFFLVNGAVDKVEDINHRVSIKIRCTTFVLEDFSDYKELPFDRDLNIPCEYLQWKADFTTNGKDTPRVNGVEFNLLAQSAMVEPLRFIKYK